MRALADWARKTAPDGHYFDEFEAARAAAFFPRGTLVLRRGSGGPDIGCQARQLFESGPAAQSGSSLAMGAAAGGVAQLLDLEPGPEV